MIKRYKKEDSPETVRWNLNTTPPVENDKITFPNLHFWLESRWFLGMVF